MADFAAVLRKTIATLKENTPEARDRIYQKARSTIDAKLKALNPPPSQQVVDQQMKVLEDAIATVEAEHAPPEPAPEPSNGLDEVLRDLEALSRAPADASWNVTEKPVQAPVIAAVPPAPANDPMPEAPTAVEEPAEEEAEAHEDDAPAVEEPVEEQPAEQEPAEPVAVEEVPAEPVAAAEPQVEETSTEPVAEVEGPEQQPLTAEAETTESPTEHRQLHADPVLDAFNDRPALRELREKKAKKSLRKPLLAVAALLLVCAVAGAGWLYREDLMQLASRGEADVAADIANAPADTSQAASSQAASSQAEAPSQQGDTATAQQPMRKLTQRLLPDGTEVDEGPASGFPTVGEGTSVAATTEVAAATPQVPEQKNNNQPAVPVGQKAIFYEERTIQEQASASDGSVVWSIEQESPGADLPPEPVIYAEATIPAKRLRLKMSIRRNVDQSLPASYIAELIFLTPEDFSGGAVGSVASVSLKRTEQDAGNRLLGVPAKIADGFFLVALSDNKADMEANNLLLGRMEWIDIPIVYTSGRRALITLEKGVPGGNVFNEALNAWKQAMSG